MSTFNTRSQHFRLRTSSTHVYRMASQLLSRYEREYIVKGVNCDCRADGRGCKDFRHFSLQLGVVSNTSGSAKVQLERTSVIVGVKAEIGTPDPRTPDAGCIEFFVDCSALASPEFEGRGGEGLGLHLAHKLTEVYRNEVSIDLPSLSIIAGQQCWVLYVDALVLEWSGSVLDAVSLAVRAALHNTRIPKLTVTGEGEEMEIQVSDNPHDSFHVDTTNAPIIVTLTQVGDNFVVDASQEEEECSTSRLSLAVSHSSQTLSVSKDRPGGIPYRKLHDVISMAQEVGCELLERMDAMLGLGPPTKTHPLR